MRLRPFNMQMRFTTSITFGLKAVNEHMFRMGDKRLKDEEHSGRFWGVHTDQLRATVENDPLKTTQ
ncbi:hypothetical protein DICVIV_00949 [Dictyocaulus viviparus]|uniref:Uncharacterized protein n=1 Tax=Dictyocaulus viviparus TaxID=29172 RepID=A0A0D8Y7S7_DICVI|nr:hypothetical protein DICVIV_00949 [Dictyocaulus viviparus]